MALNCQCLILNTPKTHLQSMAVLQRLTGPLSIYSSSPSHHHPTSHGRLHVTSYDSYSQACDSNLEALPYRSVFIRHPSRLQSFDSFRISSQKPKSRNAGRQNRPVYPSSLEYLFNFLFQIETRFSCTRVRL